MVSRADYPTEMLPVGVPDVPVHRWGTVEQISPLRVRLDGDDEVLLSDPWDMAGPRYLGERVYVQVTNRRVVIVGPGGKPNPPVDLSLYLDTTLWVPYNGSSPCIEAIRWGPLIRISGAVSPKTGNPWIGGTTSSTSQRILSGLPNQFRMRPGTGTADAGWPRQPMSGVGSWYVTQEGTELRGTRVDGASAISTSTWFPFGIWGYALDAFQ